MDISDNGHTAPQKCPVCNSASLILFVEIRQVPIHCNLLWPTREQALQAPKGDMRLGFCRECGHVFNLAFDPALMEYTQAYENSLHFSPQFQRYAESLAERLIERYDLHGKDIVDIGCGKGEFLIRLCEVGGNRGYGFDPSPMPERNVNETAGRVTFIRDFYSERYATYPADFICCRHVLEHIHSPRSFLTNVRRSIGDRRGAAVFFEVPNVMFTLKDMGIWDLIYEHCSYFSASSLSRLFRLCGFEVSLVHEAYEGQFLCLEALPRDNAVADDGPGVDLDGMASDVVAFADRYHHKVEAWARNLEQMARSGQQIVVWGAGSKGVTFLNTLRAHSQIEYVVDLNPRKQGMYVAGTGQKIVAPEFLRNYQPEAILIMNKIYRGEIQQLTERLGLTSEFVCV